MPASESTLVVLTSFRRPRRSTNPYIVMLAAALADTPGLQVNLFSWRTALRGRFDVFHVHWPETLLVGTDRKRTAARVALFALLLLRLRFSSIAVVRTVHNRQPHERLPPVSRWLYDRLEQLTQVRILLSESCDESTEPALAAGPTATILHGRYTEWFSDYEKGSPVRGRVAFVGLIRPYKNVDNLVRAFTQTGEEGLELRIVGSPSPRSIGEVLVRLAGSDPRISFDFRYVDDADLAKEVGEAEIVILPYVEMLNSGAAILALSLGRPVLVPDNPVNRRLAAEVGEQWVMRFESALQPADIVRSLQAGRAIPAGAAPDLSRRDWELAGERHRGVYEMALSLRGPSTS